MQNWRRGCRWASRVIGVTRTPACTMFWTARRATTPASGLTRYWRSASSISALEPEEQAAVVAECGHELLCSPGLRSLAPGERDYRAVYSGDASARDSAYHQGPVWGWLLGHYVIAEYRVTADRCLARQRLEAVRDHLFEAGLGTVSELFDAAPPHRARAAPAQAWSVACTLQAWWQVQGPAA